MVLYDRNSKSGRFLKTSAMRKEAEPTFEFFSTSWF